jgi:hypothetical protein
VDAENPGHEPEAPAHGRDPGRPSDPGLEPAHRPRALSDEHDAALPGRAQDAVEAVRPPDRHQVDHAAPADVDQILREQVRLQPHPLTLEPEQRQVRGLAVELTERAAEGEDLRLGVAARRRDETDSRPARVGQGEHVVADRLVAPAARELVAAEREDHPLVRAHRLGSHAGHGG